MRNNIIIINFLLGLSDPFVKLKLMPPWVFSECSEKHFKTGVQKQTVNPFFNETFKL